jgi:hypothetical protein
VELPPWDLPSEAARRARISAKDAILSCLSKL